jgi:hypothetical protein
MHERRDQFQRAKEIKEERIKSHLVLKVAFYVRGALPMFRPYGT